MEIAIYLAGSIKKAHENPDASYWTEEDMLLIRHHLKEHYVFFLNPAKRGDDLTDSFSVFGRDMLQVFSCHCVFVDARHRRGLGVGAEMMWAKLNKIPVVTWAPMDSHYHKRKTTVLGVEVNDFIHPFVEALSDKIVEDLATGAGWLHTVISDPCIAIKGLESIYAAMQYYQQTQWVNDIPMQEMFTSSEALQKGMHRANSFSY